MPRGAMKDIRMPAGAPRRPAARRKARYGSVNPAIISRKERGKKPAGIGQKVIYSPGAGKYKLRFSVETGK